MDGQPDLPGVGEALRLSAIFPSLGEDGEEDGGDERDDGDDDEEFDQRKCRVPAERG
jgi:hypothetical protein